MSCLRIESLCCHNVEAIHELPLQKRAITAIHESPGYHLVIDAGECVCISGPSGSGKSQLLRAIADLDPREGRIFLDDVDCDSISASAWRSRVGLLPAEPQWWHDTARPHFAAISNQQLARLNIPLTLLDAPVSRLSSGERQRLALLRLLAMQPQALLLDEPTSNLDPNSVVAVEALIAEYRQQHNAPVLWVSHDPAQITRVSTRHFQLTAQGILNAA